ncbi:ATP-binding protein [Candidatus Albibeggiatoa sp. nov. NOAA]|uniref:ATP-binding protein n=1 Tax=Candidatus Albibeggiatoa sp. nov. NOAA TaxID=3162724 RepID=UPI0032F5B2E7|nr:ATP-binding protein [Thiotrichaceae bacterium]
MKFSNKILLLFLGFLLGIGTLLSLFLYNAATRTTELEIKAHLQARAVYGIDKIDRLLFERAADVSSMARDPYIIANIADSENADLLTLRLLHYRNTYKFYLAISIYGHNQARIADTSSLNIGQSAPDAIWVKRVYEQKTNSTAEDIYVSKQASVMTFAAPILDAEKNILGAIVAEMNTDLIYQVLGQLNFRQDEVEKTDIGIDLIDIQGTVLYSNHDPKEVLKKKINLNNLEHLEGHFYTYAHQEGYLDFKGNNWTLIAHLPIDKAFMSITELRNQAITVGLILMVIATIGVFAFSRKLIEPIISLENCAMQLGKGDFSVRAPMLSNDEIGHLARTFNHMAQLLEQQVSQMQEFKTIFDISADMIFVLEASTQHFIYVNQAASDQSGYEVKQLLRMTPYDLLPTEKYSEIKRLFDALAQTENGIHLYETVMLRQDGSTFPVETLIQYVQLNAYESHYIAIARDITERKQAERALKSAKERAERANQTKTVFLSNMSHELRTPLNGILGYTQILKLDDSLSSRQQEGINIIHRSGEYLLTMINDILDLSKIESDNLNLHHSEFQLVKLLNNIVELFRLRVQQKGIQFIFNPSADLPQTVLADESRLRQALVNILNNALKSTEQGEIRLEVFRFEDKVRFTVQDTGGGIAQHNIEQVLDPFKQLDARGFEVEGAGLGLTITNKIVKLMQGEFTITSQLGQGSRFTIDLALQEIVSSEPFDQFDTSQAIMGYKGELLTVFVIDDEWESRQTLVEILNALAFKVYAFSHYQEALIQLEQTPPHIIITDLSLLKKYLEVKKSPLTDIPLIVTAENMYEHQAGRLDYNALIAKPIHLEELLNQLQKILNIHWLYDKQNAEPQSEQIEQDQYGQLSQQQANIFYDLGRKGDIMGLLHEAEILKQDHNLLPLAEHIIQLSKDFDADAVCQLVEPFTEQSS